MFNRELALLNESRVGLKGMTVAGKINENVTIIKADSFNFVYVFDIGNSVDIVSQHSFGEDKDFTLSFDKGEQLDLIISTLQSLV